MPGAMLTDVRNAARGLWRSPTVAISAILCLALGIGATTAISSAIRQALMRSLPFRDPGHVVAVHRITPQSGPMGTWPQSPANYVDLARESHQIVSLAAMSGGTALVQLQGATLQARQRYVTGNLFPMLGARPELGRLLTPDDDRLDTPLVAVLSDEFWRARLGADPSVIGRTIPIDGEPTTIVGIAPIDFRIPHGFQSVVRADVWMPIRFTPQRLAVRRNNFLQLLGRLAPGATVESADKEMKSLFAGLVATYPQLNGENLRVAPLQSENLQSVRTPLLLLLGAVGMVLLIAATNVAALLLARGVHRRRELAVRTALGATRWAVMRPALTESAIITAIGVLLGLGVALAGVRTIGALAAARIPQLAGMHIDVGVIAFAVLLAAVVAVACGAVPAWRGTRIDPQDALRGGRGGGAGREHHRTLRSLVVVEVALSVILLIGAGLVLKGFASLLARDPGFETDHVLTMHVSLDPQRYAGESTVHRFLEPALDAVRALPGIQGAGAITAMPYENWGNNSNIRYEGMPGDDPTRLPIVEQRGVTTGFFAMTGQHLVAGRQLRSTDDERPESPAVVVVNQALVDRDFKGQDVVGKRFHLSDSTFATIVGVVSNIRNAGPVAPPQPGMYWNYSQMASGASSFPLMIRVTTSDPIAVAGSIQAAIHRIDSQAAIANIRSMDEVIANSLGRPRFYFSLLGSFAGVAVILTIAGLYGVLSYAVAQRTREIGIRAALGSPGAALVGLVVGQGFRLVAIGIGLGLVGGFGVTRLMTFMLYGVSPLDALTWVAAAVLLFVAAMFATLIPALRASRVSPVVAMQTE